MKKSSFKRPTYQEALEKACIKASKALATSKTPLRRTKLRIAGHSTTKELRDEIQAVLRQIVIIKDGGCFLRNYTDRITPQYRNCGGYRKDGELILQAEHLHSRSNANSFSDPRLIVCCCQRHHIYYKAQHSAEYNELAREYIGQERAKLWDRVKNDHKPYKVDLKLELLALKQQLNALRNSQ